MSEYRQKTRWEMPFHSRIFIGNFDHRNISREQVEKIFSKYGEIKERIQIHQGYCFIQYTDEDTATRALNSENGRYLGTKKIEIQYAKVTSRDRNTRDRNKDSYKRKRYDDKPDYSPPTKRYKSNIRESSTSRTLAVTSTPKTPPKIPLFVFGYTLLNYSNIVKQQFASAGITADAHFVGNDFMKTVPNETYLLYIFPRNAISSTICFCAVDNAGSSEGFIDTPLVNVVNYCAIGLGVATGQVTMPTTTAPNYNVNYSYNAQQAPIVANPQNTGYSPPQPSNVQPTSSIPQYSNPPATTQSVQHHQGYSQPQHNPANSGLKGLLNRLSNIQKK